MRKETLIAQIAPMKGGNHRVSYIVDEWLYGGHKIAIICDAIVKLKVKYANTKFGKAAKAAREAAGKSEKGKHVCWYKPNTDGYPFIVHYECERKDGTTDIDLNRQYLYMTNAETIVYRYVPNPKDRRKALIGPDGKKIPITRYVAKTDKKGAVIVDEDGVAITETVHDHNVIYKSKFRVIYNFGNPDESLDIDIIAKGDPTARAGIERSVLAYRTASKKSDGRKKTAPQVGGPIVKEIEKILSVGEYYQVGSLSYKD